MVDVYGVDISNDLSFVDGDIELVSGEDNLRQAITNRLRTDWDFYQDFYAVYGGRLSEHFGDFNVPTIHEYVKIEVESILSQEPRIRNVECIPYKNDKEELSFNLNYTVIGEDETQTLNLIISSDSSISINTNTVGGQ